MDSKLTSRQITGIVVLIFLCAVFGQARSQSSPGPLDEYERTLNALEQYRVLAAEDDGSLLPETSRPVQPGERYDGVPRLIRLLRHVGDLSADLSANSNLYQGALVAAVRRFQARHGLQPDGRIDKATLAQMNTPLAFRVHQLELALERWRRRPYDPSSAAIVLNIPEFRLRAFRENHQDLEMKIVVGQAPEHKTPLLSSEMEQVIFRPYWNVPLTIQRDELVPEILKNPRYLAANHIELITAGGPVTPASLSSDMLDQLRSGDLRLRQTPGPQNVLGLAKFVFPNEYDVYMHGTSAPALFAHPRRDFSHGCIRVERPEDLAEWVLRDESGWPRKRIVQAMRGSESTAVKLTRPIQVVTMYATAIVLENGEVRFFEDIYGEDEVLENELK